uniref:Uncharacterized protein n=1 Tax=Pararge aegeria TaxID=116150 RepID=S4PWV1_9NEOP
MGRSFGWLVYLYKEKKNYAFVTPMTSFAYSVVRNGYSITCVESLLYRFRFQSAFKSVCIRRHVRSEVETR